MLVSALTGEGIDDAAGGHRCAPRRARRDPDRGDPAATQGRLLSWLHDNAEVLDQETAESGAVTARFRIDPAIKGKLEGQLKRAGLAATRR